MITVIDYRHVSGNCAGVLYWDADGNAAGGVSPPPITPLRGAVTIVTDWTGRHQLDGWIHPDTYFADRGRRLLATN